MAVQIAIIPLLIIAAIILAVIGFLAIVDYLVIALSIITALYIYGLIEKNYDWGEPANIIVSVVLGFLAYKMALGATFIVIAAGLLMFTPKILERYMGLDIEKINALIPLPSIKTSRKKKK